MIIEKKCKCCNIVKPISSFYKHETGKDGHRNHCISCCLDKQKKVRDERRAAVIAQENKDAVNKTTKVCSICKADKPFDAFKKRKSNVDGLESVCLCCKSKVITEHRDMFSDGKTCGHCNEFFPLTMFDRKKSTLSGYSSWCKNCTKILRKISWEKNKSNEAVKRKEYRDENRERCRFLSKEHYRVNKERYSALAKEYRKNNLVRIRQQCKDYYLANTAMYRAHQAFRKSWKLNATPPWLNKGHKQEIQDFYTACKMFRLYTGEDYHVDHIVPLLSNTVCGLHVPWNLQILQWKENVSKGNRYWPDMPGKEQEIQ